MNDMSQGFLDDEVRADLQGQPYLLMRLTENALTVAESLRDNYFRNTAHFVRDLRRSMRRAAVGDQASILDTRTVAIKSWAGVNGEVTTFIDGGIGRVQIASQIPILLRVGSYCVRVGDRQLSRREQFGYYPVILGDLEGGSRDRKDFVDIVRITAELLGGLAALERTPDLRVLMFHGPLVYLVGSYAGHSPFTERDVDRLLHHYGGGAERGTRLKEDFLVEASLHTYPAMTNHARWAEKRLFEPLAWMSFLYRRLVRIATARKPRPVIAGVVERGGLREFCEDSVLPRVFAALRENGNADYFNELFGRNDLASPKALLDKLGYTDGLLLAMLLQPGHYTEPWVVNKYEGLRRGDVTLPGEPETHSVNFAPLARSPLGFPQVMACYVQVVKNAEPIRVEVFGELGVDQIDEAAARAALYSALLPRYGFPVGLDIADKYAHVPAWLTGAYGKLIKHHLGVSLQQGEISDAETRRLLVQAIYMTNRDWLFRPSVD